MTPIVVSYVKQSILKLKNSACLDFYDLISRIMKASCDVITEPLEQLFNKCIQDGIWPDNLKITKVIPLLKKGNVNGPLQLFL